MSQGNILLQDEPVYPMFIREMKHTHKRLIPQMAAASLPPHRGRARAGWLRCRVAE